MIKLIIFDFDGVIVTGSNEGYFACYHKALESVGVKLDPEEERKRILEYWGKGHIAELELLLKEKPHLVSNAVKIYEDLHDSPFFSERIKLISGTKEALFELSKNYSLAIATGMRRHMLNMVLNKFKILNFFKVIESIDEIEKAEDKKPSPVILNKITNKLSITKDNTIYVGDDENDILMAKNAGVTPIVVLTGNLSKNKVQEYGVSYVQDITKLKTIL